MTEFPKAFNPSESEERWYSFWNERGYFSPEVNPSGEPYTIVIPPPNVTGSLHMGHALNATIQDALVRRMRMMGRRALWLPGTDHAGIATQNVVERQLAAEGTDRHAMGREKFIERVWQWKAHSGGTIINQLKKIGASCDWSRERFTLDEGLSRAVREVFVRLHEDGLLYRDTRLINWCPRCHTALSDLEVEHEDLQGILTHIKYPLAEGGHLTVATTRPETMLGDTGVAVNPDDERYRHLIGKQIDLPLTGRRIPVVADAAVDPAFGSGAVKVTPAHDFNDEAMAKRSGLPSLVVISDQGKMTAEAGPKYKGLDRYACRRAVVEDLKALGLIEKEDKHTHAVGHCYRCKSVVEPLAKPQWFVKVEPLAQEAMKAVREDRIRIVPEGWENSYFAWMENIRDWCITRQIWWGHRIPVWYCKACNETIVSRTDPDKCPKCGGDIEQDPDVLDTWFSSALWPFSTLGWPDRTIDLQAHYPTSVLVTAFDILFFWVARMIMMGCRFMDNVPFKDVYIHALVRDSEGQKMSKSKGNVIDPLIMSEKYGTDAFRFTLAAFAAQGRDVRFSEERVEGYRHFINKLWNATRFALMNIPEGYEPKHIADLRARVEDPSRNSSVAAKWILSRLWATAEEVNKAYDEYRFNDAAGAVYQFAWRELCDWYIEISKSEPSVETAETLLYTIESVLRLLHPVMPFVTEEIWQRLPIVQDRESIMTAPFPQGIRRDLEAEAVMAAVFDAVLGIRNIRGELNIPPIEIVEARIKTADADTERMVKENLPAIEKLARAKVTESGVSVPKPEGAYTSVKDRMEVYVMLAGLDLNAERERLGKERAKAVEALTFIEKKLQNPDFAGRAPKAVVDKEKARREELVAKLGKIDESLAKLKA